MENNKLTLALSGLKKKEMTRFAAFCHSDYHNKHRDVRILVDYLAQKYPNFSKKNCSRQVLLQKVFKDELDLPKLALIFTYSYRLYLEFLAIENFKKKKFRVELNTLENLMERWDLEKAKQFTKNHFKDIDDQVSKTDKLRYLQYKERITNGTGSLQDQKAFQKQQEILDDFYWSEKLRFACEGISLKRITKSDYPISYSESINKMVENAENHSPTIDIYSAIYKLQNQKITFDDCLKKIDSRSSEFSPSELQDFFNHLQNFCIQQINQGQTKFIHSIFTIYKRQLQNKSLLINGELPEWHYKNIVTAGLRSNDLEWVHNFIESFKPLLNEEVRENAYNFNLANYHYHKGDFKSVLSLLNITGITDIRYALALRSLLLRTYYELEEFESLFNLNLSFQKYLRRAPQLNKQRVQAFINLLRLTEQCAKIKISAPYWKKEKTAKTLDSLTQKLANTEKIIFKSWIEKKINALNSHL